MRDYSRKILPIFIGVSSIFNLSYLPASLYTMSNSPAQMKAFILQGFLFWIIISPIIISCAYLLIKPIQNGLVRAADAKPSREELIELAHKNLQLPIVLGMMLTVLNTIGITMVYVLYRAQGAGPIGARSMFITVIAGTFTIPLCMYGSLYFAISPAHNYLYKICHERGFAFINNDTGIGKKIVIHVIMIVCATLAWMATPSLYECIFRIHEEARSNILATHKIVLQEITRAKAGIIGIEDIKELADEMSASGLGPTMVANTQGETLYNPHDIELFNKKWPDINKSIRDGLDSGKPGSLYENIHEQLICHTPAQDGLVLVTTVRIAEKLPRLLKFLMVTGLFSLVIFGAIITVSISLMFMIVRPISKTKDKVFDLSAGEADLTGRLEILSNDESGYMAMEFNEFIAKLDSIINRVKHAAFAVSSATQEVASGSQSLSKMTQAQAASIEQVSSTIEQMTSSIKNNAQNAITSRQKVNKMVEMAAESGQSSKELESSMGSILAASKKIEDIVITVNEVAFQTNLLALNAAVEAARAGEQGKGFAVVAEEVRALAQRSTSAVHEIKALIEDTVKKIHAGDAVVKKTGSVLNEIIAHINELALVMEEIAAASAEQATGVDEVNRAINHIDTSTQHNANTVEELHGNAENLNAEAENLISVVERFKVSDTNDEQEARRVH